MRSILVMVLALAAFGWRVVDSHRRADDLALREAVIPAELLERARSGVTDRDEALGYRFTWVAGGEWEAILIAGPVEAGRTGVRWFATRDGLDIFEYDPTVFSATASGPNPRPIQKYLSVPADQRSSAQRPAGWRPLQ